LPPQQEQQPQQQKQPQQQQQQQQQQQLQMMLSSARMSQVLAAMQAQAPGTAGSASSSGNGLLARQSSSDEMAALFPGAASFAVNAVAAGTHQARRTDEGTQRASSGPTHKRAEARAPVWGSAFTLKAAKLHGGLE
jgi:hypothetical protein